MKRSYLKVWWNTKGGKISKEPTEPLAVSGRNLAAFLSPDLQESQMSTFRRLLFTLSSSCRNTWAITHAFSKQAMTSSSLSESLAREAIELGDRSSAKPGKTPRILFLKPSWKTPLRNQLSFNAAFWAWCPSDVLDFNSYHPTAGWDGGSPTHLEDIRLRELDWCIIFFLHT